jgi:leucyl aminopeptidase
MQVGATNEDVLTCSGDVLVLPVAAGGSLPEVTRRVAAAAGLDLAAIAARFRLEEAGDRCWVPVPAGTSLGCADLLLVCVGAAGPDGASPSGMRTAAMSAGRHACRPSVVCALGSAAVSGRDAAELAAEGMVLGAYRYDRYRTRPAPEQRAEQISFPGASEAAVRVGAAIGQAANLARDLTNTAPADLTPAAFAGICEDLAAEHGFSYSCLQADQLQAEGFGGIAGVGAGSPNPPVLACIGRGDGPALPVALVGKGITFDSGGLDLKQLSWMLQMKDDMAGAAAIIAAMTAMASVGSGANVRAYLALAENAVSGSATRPGDVLRHRDGRTTEVVSPDAEGRLVLADAISYAREQPVAQIIDVSTLTGSTGLGPDLWGIMGNSQPLIDDVLRAGESSGEPGWQLPLWEGYRRKLRSDIADIRNLELGAQWPHAAVWGGLYLSEFAGDTPWAHLDIGATVLRPEADDVWIAGATGSGTRTLVEYLRRSGADPGAS